MVFDKFLFGFFRVRFVSICKLVEHMPIILPLINVLPATDAVGSTLRDGAAMIESHRIEGGQVSFSFRSRRFPEKVCIASPIDAGQRSDVIKRGFVWSEIRRCDDAN